MIESANKYSVAELCNQFEVPLNSEWHHLSRLSAEFKAKIWEAQTHVTLLHYNTSKSTTDGIAEKFCKMLELQGWTVEHIFNKVSGGNNHHIIKVLFLENKARENLSDKKYRNLSP